MDVITDKAFDYAGCRPEGLDYVTRKILRNMIEMYGGPVCLGTPLIHSPRWRLVEHMYANLTSSKGFITSGQGLTWWLLHMSI